MHFYKKVDLLSHPEVAKRIEYLSERIKEDEKKKKEGLCKQSRLKEKQRNEKLIENILKEQAWHSANEFCEKECIISKYKIDKDFYQGSMTSKQQPVKLQQVQDLNRQ